jgi:hypothetical protein
MLEPVCHVRVAVASTREPSDMVLQYCLYIYIYSFMNYIRGKFHIYFFRPVIQCILGILRQI